MISSYNIRDRFKSNNKERTMPLPIAGPTARKMVHQQTITLPHIMQKQQITIKKKGKVPQNVPINLKLPQQTQLSEEPYEPLDNPPIRMERH